MVKMNTIGLSDWSSQNLFTVPGTFSVSAGNLVAPPGALFANPVAYTTSAYDMTDSSFDVEIISPGVGGFGLEAWFGIRPNPTAAWTDEAGYIITGDGTLIPLVYVAGVSTQASSITFNATNHKYLRVRVAGSTTYWESSSNRSTWTQLWTRANPFQMTSQHAYVGSSLWQEEPGHTPPVYGDVNGGSPTPPVNAGTDQTVAPWTAVTLTGSGTGSSTWTQISGTTVTLFGSGTTRTFMAPASMSTQTLVFDYGGDTVNITVSRAKHGIVQADKSVKPVKVRIYTGVVFTADATDPGTFTTTLSLDASDPGTFNPAGAIADTSDPGTFSMI